MNIVDDFDVPDVLTNETHEEQKPITLQPDDAANELETSFGPLVYESSSAESDECQGNDTGLQTADLAESIAHGFQNLGRILERRHSIHSKGKIKIA